MNSNDIIRIFDTDKISIESILKRSSKILGFNDNDYKLIVKEFNRMKLEKLFSIDIPIKGVKITKLNYGIIKIKISTVLGKNNKDSIDIVISKYIETSEVLISIVNFVWFDEINFFITLDYAGLVRFVNIIATAADTYTLYNPNMGRYDKKSSYRLNISSNVRSPEIDCTINNLYISYMDNFSEVDYSHYLKNRFETNPVFSFAFNIKISERWGKDSVVKIPFSSINSILDIINMPIDTKYITLAPDKSSIVKRELDFDDKDMYLIKNMNEVFSHVNLQEFIKNILYLNIVKNKNEVIEYLKTITATDRLLEHLFRDIFRDIDFARYESQEESTIEIKKDDDNCIKEIDGDSNMKEEYVIKIDENKKLTKAVKDPQTINIVSEPLNSNESKAVEEEIASEEYVVKMNIPRKFKKSKGTSIHRFPMF